MKAKMIEGLERDYHIVPKHNGKFFIKAYRPGGAEARLPFKDFNSKAEAEEWITGEEAKMERLAASMRQDAITL